MTQFTCKGVKQINNRIAFKHLYHAISWHEQICLIQIIPHSCDTDKMDKRMSVMMCNNLKNSVDKLFVLIVNTLSSCNSSLSVKHAFKNYKYYKRKRGKKIYDFFQLCLNQVRNSRWIKGCLS
jgi:hypothetical protein